MRDLLQDIERFKASGQAFGRAVVTTVWGSAPRPAGACLVADGHGALAGSVSGGCIEAATAAEIAAAIGAGRPRLVEFGVTNERAWEVGLACGGTIKLLVEPVVREEAIAAAAGPSGAVLATVLESPSGLGAALLIDENGDDMVPLPAAGNRAQATDGSRELQALGQALVGPALEALAQHASRTQQFTTEAGSSVTVFFEVFPGAAKLVIFGGVHIARALVPMARLLGYRTIVADGRQPFLTRERFPDADELILGWPAEAFEQAGLDAATSVCVLTHDPKFDDPALEIALRSPAAYVGAIGSRKTQTARRQRLKSAGLSDTQLDRLHGPIGLDLGGREPAEIALAILAEMTAVRHASSTVPSGPGARRP
ncbi:MAG TPA: XdhC family protein [Gemmatimonadales bacterium]|nr:XdhC family protein [Gemmatimonadales bacterium]